MSGKRQARVDTLSGILEEEATMFNQMFESMQKASCSAIEMQQELFRKCFGAWPGVPLSAPVFAEPMKFQKKWADLVGELVKKQQETLQAQFSAGLKNLEEAFRLGQAKNPEELRTRTFEWWQKMFDGLRQTYEAQSCEFKSAVDKWTELLTKEPA